MGLRPEVAMYVLPIVLIFSMQENLSSSSSSSKSAGKKKDQLFSCYDFFHQISPCCLFPYFLKIMLLDFILYFGCIFGMKNIFSMFAIKIVFKYCSLPLVSYGILHKKHTSLITKPALRHHNHTHQTHYNHLS